MSENRAWISLAHLNFRHYLFGRFLALIAYQMMAVGLGQYVFEQTRNPLYLGYVGLVLFAPKFGLSLFGGHTADHFDRKRIMVLCRATQLVMSLVLVAFLISGSKNLVWLYGLLFVMGAAGAFEGPAGQALVPQLVPDTHFSNAVAWNSWFFQIAFIVGPLVAGFVYHISPLSVFWAIVGLRLLAVVFVLLIKTPRGGLDSGSFIPEKARPLGAENQIAFQSRSTVSNSDVRDGPWPLEFFTFGQGSRMKLGGKPPSKVFTWKGLLAGIHYVREKRIILGIISLDLFAVLLGGAVALMPFFANEILKVGPTGLGILRAAPAVGAALMALVLAFMPAMKKPGKIMLRAVAVFGIFTVLFGLSRHFIFSLLCLAVLGAADMISVVIRGTLVQVLTPPEMRGRVSAINLVFIGASNELGEFESGLTAAWFGVVPAVVIGGIGTLAVVLGWRKLFPEISQYSSNPISSFQNASGQNRNAPDRPD